MDWVSKLKSILEEKGTHFMGYKEVKKVYEKIETAVKTQKHGQLFALLQDLEDKVDEATKLSKKPPGMLLRKKEYKKIKEELKKMADMQVEGSAVNSVQALSKDSGTKGRESLDLKPITDSLNILTEQVYGISQSAQTAAYEVKPLKSPLSLCEKNIKLVETRINILTSDIEKSKEILLRVCTKAKPFSVKSGLTEMVQKTEEILSSSQTRTSGKQGATPRQANPQEVKAHKTGFTHIHKWVSWLNAVKEDSEKQKLKFSEEPERLTTKEESKKLEKIISDAGMHIQKLTQQLRATEARVEGLTMNYTSEIEKLKEEIKVAKSKQKRGSDTRIKSASRSDLQGQVELLRTENHKLNNDLQEAIAQKDYWMKRLSSIAGAKLVGGNPLITDLSDPNRPQKLAERFGELYDNEWTNALEVLLGDHVDRERESVLRLAVLLKKVYEYCTTFRKNQIKNLTTVLYHSNADTDKQTEKDSDDTTPSVEVRSIILDLQKKSANQTRNNVLKGLMTILEEESEFKTEVKLIPNFVQECFNICWLMSLHDPPPCFFWPNQKSNNKFDPEMFTFFTQSGSVIDYVVWPALLLHDGGPLLRKGVIQPKK